MDTAPTKPVVVEFPPEQTATSSSSSVRVPYYPARLRLHPSSKHAGAYSPTSKEERRKAKKEERRRKKSARR